MSEILTREHLDIIEMQFRDQLGAQLIEIDTLRAMLATARRALKLEDDNARLWVALEGVMADWSPERRGVILTGYGLAEDGEG